MKFWEAMKALEEGQKLQRPYADKHSYIALSPVRRDIRDECNQLADLSMLFMVPEDKLQIYQEPGHDWAWAKAQLRAGIRVTQKYGNLKPSWFLAYDDHDDIVWVRYYDQREAPTEKWVSFEDEDATNWILG